MGETVAFFTLIGKNTLSILIENDLLKWPISGSSTQLPLYLTTSVDSIKGIFEREKNKNLNRKLYIARIYLGKSYVEQISGQEVGSDSALELWILPENMSGFNKNIMGKIEIG